MANRPGHGALAYFSQPRFVLQMRFQIVTHTVVLSFLQVGIAVNQLEGHRAHPLEQLEILRQIGKAQRRQSMLTCAQEIAWTTQA